MRKLQIVIATVWILFTSCTNRDKQIEEDSGSIFLKDTNKIMTPQLTIDQANKLADLPFQCLDQEYPNKMGHVTAGPADLKTPKETHPAFYGCFDWHSAVHGHWSAIALLKKYPDVKNNQELLLKLKTNLTAANIAVEIQYLNTPDNTSFERTYGWAWLLKLQQELDTWNHVDAPELSKNLQPLTNLIIERYIDYLPKLNYAIRVGEHTNSAFGLAFAFDYAVHSKNNNFKDAITKRALEFYKTDTSCPITWEPSGYDFLSPCLEELDIMRRVLEPEAFHKWAKGFLPGIEEGNLNVTIGKVSDRTDGKLVHIDGLNLSRSWVIYGLIAQYPNEYKNLQEIADEHMQATLPNLAADDYAGGHWLGSFAIYALQEAAKVEKSL